MSFQRRPYQNDMGDHISISIGTLDPTPQKNWQDWEYPYNYETEKMLKKETTIFIILWIICVVVCIYILCYNIA